eukprot:14160273-Ditylum_brightwellii.AAC.1
MKDYLKAAFKWADIAGYPFGGVQKKKKTAVESAPPVHPDTVLIPGIMHEKKISGNAAAIQQQACSTSDNDESKSDDGVNCDVDYSDFCPEKHLAEAMKKVMARK